MVDQADRVQPSLAGHGHVLFNGVLPIGEGGVDVPVPSEVTDHECAELVIGALGRMVGRSRTTSSGSENRL